MRRHRKGPNPWAIGAVLIALGVGYLIGVYHAENKDILVCYPTKGYCEVQKPKDVWVDNECVIVKNVTKECGGRFFRIDVGQLKREVAGSCANELGGRIVDISDDWTITCRSRRPEGTIDFTVTPFRTVWERVTP